MRLIRDGEKGKGVWRWGGRERLYTYRYTVTTRMGSDESLCRSAGVLSNIDQDKLKRLFAMARTSVTDSANPKRPSHQSYFVRLKLFRYCIYTDRYQAESRWERGVFTLVFTPTNIKQKVREGSIYVSIYTDRYQTEIGRGEYLR